MPRVFISYVHEDKEIVQAIQSLLVDTLKLEADVFLSADQTQILAGHIWLDRISNSGDTVLNSWPCL